MRTTSELRTISVVAARTPDWLPPEGQYGRVPMLNTLLSQEPPIPPGHDPRWTFGRGFGNLLAEYSGAAFADGYSPLGALCLHGGGHNGWWGNDVHVADLSTLTWTRVIDPSIHSLAVNQIDYDSRCVADKVHWELQDGTPAIIHTYDTLEYGPPSWGTMGAKGSLVRLCAQGVKLIHAQRADLGARAWRRLSVNENILHSGLSFYPMAAKDDSRQCFYVAQGSQAGASKYYRIDKSGVVTELSGSFGTGGAVMCMGYAPPPLDLIIVMGGSKSTSPFGLRRPDVAGNPLTPPWTGERPVYGGSNGVHPEWDPDRNCFVFWDPLAETIYKLHPPDGDPLTQSWAWTTEVLQKSEALAPKVVRKAAGGQWSKLRRVPPLKAFVYPASTTELQIIRPKGA